MERNLDPRDTVTVKVVALFRAIVSPLGWYCLISILKFSPCLPTACYAQRFGPRGIGHAGGTFLGLMSDALDLEWQRYRC